MNILFWVLQVALAFLFLSGGAYKTFAFAEIANQMRAIPHAGWRAIGVLEMLGAILLVVPAATKWMPTLTPLAASVLTVEALSLAALFATYSLTIAVTNPMVWNLVMGLLVGFVAYGRYVLSPLA